MLSEVTNVMNLSESSGCWQQSDAMILLLLGGMPVGVCQDFLIRISILNCNSNVKLGHITGPYF